MPKIVSLMERIGDTYASLFARERFANLNKGLMYLGARGLGMKNFRTDLLSGEHQIISRFINPERPQVIFDVGANVGDWAADVLRKNPAHQVHLFEPQQRLAEQLRKRFPNARVNACATSDARGELELFDYSEHGGSEHATLLPNVIESIHAGKSRKASVPICRLDEYCLDAGVEKIDFLKVDVEGFELKTLKGCGKLVSQARIEAIQFEFNEMNIVSRVYLTDFFDLLAPQYKLFRLLRSGLLPLERKQHWINEQFTFQNILAVKSSN